MTDIEGLVEEAKNRYPIGTEYRALNSEGEPFINAESVHTAESYGDKIGAGPGYIYVNGIWADILEPIEKFTQIPSHKNLIKPTRKELLDYAIKHYPTGTRYIRVGMAGLKWAGVVNKVHTVSSTGDWVEAGLGFIYEVGEWAKIIKEEVRKPAEPVPEEPISLEEEEEEVPPWEELYPTREVIDPIKSKAQYPMAIEDCIKSKPKLLLYREDPVQKIEIKLSNNKRKKKK